MPSRGSLERVDPGERIGDFEVLGRILGTDVLVGVDHQQVAVAIRKVRMEEHIRLSRLASAVEPARRHCSLPVVWRDLEATTPYVVTPLVQGVALGHAVEEVGPRPALEVTVVATALAEHLVALHRAGLVDGRLAPTSVILSKSRPYVVDPVATSSEGSREEDVRRWAAVVWFAATGSAMPEGDLDPTALGGLDPGLAALVCAAGGQRPEERPTAEALLEQLLGRRLPDDVAGAVGAVVGRTWRMDAELSPLVGPGQVGRPVPEPEPEPEPRRSGGDLAVAAGRSVARGLAQLVVVAVVVVVLAFLALRFAIR